MIFYLKGENSHRTDLHENVQLSNRNNDAARPKRVNFQRKNDNPMSKKANKNGQLTLNDDFSNNNSSSVNAFGINDDSNSRIILVTFELGVR